jgi:hypothetical protein
VAAGDVQSALDHHPPRRPAAPHMDEIDLVLIAHSQQSRLSRRDRNNSSQMKRLPLNESVLIWSEDTDQVGKLKRFANKVCRVQPGEGGPYCFPVVRAGENNL